MLKVLSLSSITQTKRIAIKKEIMNLIDANIGDDILYILDKNGIVNIRKFKGNVTLGIGEKYISSSIITQHKPHLKTSITIASDVRNAVNVDIGDKILWILDNDGNIIIRNNVILGKCSKNIFNKDITALLIYVSSLTFQNQISIPKEITDILGVYEGDKFILSLDEYGNIIVSKEIEENLLQEVNLLEENLLQESIISRQYPTIYLKQTTIDIIEPIDNILWFFDEKGNIIIKNDLLPDNCT